MRPTLYGHHTENRVINSKHSSKEQCWLDGVYCAILTLQEKVKVQLDRDEAPDYFSALSELLDEARTISHLPEEDC